MTTRPIEILLVEDNPGDVELAREGLATARTPSRLHAVGTGVDALAFLRHEGRYASSPRPDLIILDLNLPLLSGREVLQEVKADPALRRIPVVILTSSSAEQDIAQTYDLHANCYLLKPVELQRYLDAIRSIEEFWLVAARIPGPGLP